MFYLICHNVIEECVNKIMNLTTHWLIYGHILISTKKLSRLYTPLGPSQC